MDKTQKEKIDMINSLGYNEILYLKIRLYTLSLGEIHNLLELKDSEKLKNFKELVETINNKELDYKKQEKNKNHRKNKSKRSI